MNIKPPYAEIRSRTDLRQIIPNLQKSGNEFWSLCPFHAEKTPSFHVNKEFFHCFGCGISGDLVNWYESFPGGKFEPVEALRLAALEAGIALDPGYEQQVQKMVEERERRQEALTFYQTKLEDSEKAYQYLANRGMAEETIKHFGLGYRPDWDAIAIPIYSKSGNLDSISFRYLDPENKQRYHHRNNDYWTKGENLYNACALEFETGPIYICEGMFDVMSIWQLGFRRVVGIMGGTLNDFHVRQFGDSPVVFIPDSKSENDFDLFKKSVFRLRNSHSNLVIRVAMLPEGDANSVDPVVLKAAIENAEGAELAILKADLSKCLDIDSEYKMARKIATDIQDPLTKDDIVRWLATRWEKSKDVVTKALTRSDSPVTRVKTIADALDELTESERTAEMEGLGIRNMGVEKYVDRPRTGQIMLVAARPGVGKTLFALNVLYNCHKAQIPTLFISQEQPAKELGYRLCLMLGGDTGKVDNATLRHNIVHGTDWWVQHRHQLEEMLPHVRIDARRLTPVTVRDSIIDASYSLGDAVKVVFIDYLGLLRDDGRANTAYEKASAIARDIQDVTKEIDYFGIYPLQVTREGGDGTERITYDMNRDSGVFEEIADYWVGLWRDKKSAEGLADMGLEQINGNVGKNRHGATGDFSLIKDRTTLRLTPMEPTPRQGHRPQHDPDTGELPVDPFDE